MSKKTIYLLLILFFSLSLPLFSQKDYLVDINELSYKRNFHQGLEFYQTKSYKAAIEKFLVALRYNSSNPLVRYYLGSAFYKLGYVEDALLQWETIIKLGKQDNYLVNKINQIYYSLGKQNNKNFIFKDYIFLESYPTKNYRLSSKPIDFPTSIWVDKQDNILVMDAGTKQLIEISGNGKITRKHISRFLLNTEISLKNIVIPVVKKPFDFVFVNKESYYITDFSDNKIISFVSNKVKWIVTNNQYHSLLGPQGIAIDNEQNIYVTDIGNAKVHTYNRNGKYLQSFGKRGSKKGELLLPSDILYYKEKIFISDKGNHVINVFDQYGNYLKDIGEGILRKPRALALYDENQIAIVDHQEVYLCDLKKIQYKEILNNINSPDKKLVPAPNNITSIAVDKQKNIYLANATTGKIDILAPQENLYANLWIEIENIYIKEYPKISLEVSVRNKKEIPIVNLSKQNFIVEDNYERKAAAIQKLYKQKNINPVIVVDNYHLTPSQKNTLEIIIDQLYHNLLQADNLSLVTLKETKNQKDNFNIAKISGFNKNKRTTLKKLSKAFIPVPTTKNTKSTVEWSKVLNHAIQQNLNHQKRKGIVFICFKPYDKKNFKYMPYQKLLYYAKNNHIPIHVFYVGNNLSEQKLYWLKNLASKTNGKFYIYRSNQTILDLYDLLRNNNEFIYEINYLNEEKYDDEGKFKPIKVIVNYKNSWGENRHHGYISP